MCSKASGSRSRRASTSAAIAPNAHVRFAYTIEMAKLEDGVERLARFLGDRMTSGASERMSRSSDRRPPSPLVAVVAALALAGCSAVEFYWQGLAGQVDSSRARSRSPEVDRNDARPGAQGAARARAGDPRVRVAASSRCPTIAATRATPTSAGRSWSGTCSRRRSSRSPPRQWCFPVAGCVAYRGYFAESDARAEAARLAAEGDDVHVGGVPAYSTLGYFDDPVLSTFVRYREVELARLIFHELAHQVVYVKDDTSFNESFAVTVEEEGLARWLAAKRRRDPAEAAQLAADVARGQRCAPSSAR